MHNFSIRPVWLHVEFNAIVLDVLITARGSRNRVMGTHDQRLKIQLVAPPVNQQANRALVHFLAVALRLAKAQIEIVAGATSSRKTVRLADISAARTLLGLQKGQAACGNRWNGSAGRARRDSC